MDLAPDLHAFSKQEHYSFVRFSFIESLDDMLETHVVYKLIYRWLLEKCAYNRWNLLDYCNIYNTTFYYFFYFCLYKHPEIEWTDIKKDLDPLILEDLKGDIEKHKVVKIIIAALLFFFGKKFKYFSLNYLKSMNQYSKEWGSLVKMIQTANEANKLPALKITLHLDLANTKRLLKIFGARGCYLIYKHLDNSVKDDKIEKHFDDVIKAIFKDCKNDDEKDYYFHKLGYAVLITDEGYIYDPTFISGCEMDVFIATFENEDKRKEEQRIASTAFNEEKAKILLTGIIEPDKVVVHNYGYQDFYGVVSRKNENDLLHWYEDNGVQLENNLKIIGYTWCYIFECTSPSDGKEYHPNIYLFIGRDISRITVSEFMKDAIDSAPQGTTYTFCEESIKTIDLTQYYTSSEKLLSECETLRVIDTSTSDINNYSFTSKHIRHLDDEKKESVTETKAKTKGRPTTSLKDCMLVEDKDALYNEMKTELSKLPDGPTKANYINELRKSGKLSKFPSFRALVNAGMIDLSESAWNNAMSRYR